jgi:hypothetical protein
MTNWIYELPESLADDAAADDRPSSGSSAVALRDHGSPDTRPAPRLRPASALAQGLAAIDAITEMVMDLARELEREARGQND